MFYSPHKLIFSKFYFLGKRVASFGDGPGAYKEYLIKTNKLITYDAFDGAPFVEETTDNQVAFLDLSVPVYHLSKYDWIMSLEVAEHIPQEYESIFIDNLVRHAKEGIILSWSRPGQMRHSHVNNRDLEYVKNQMKKRGFSHNKEESNRLKIKAKFEWLKNNINVYKKI